MLPSPTLKLLTRHLPRNLKTMSSQAQFTKNLPSRKPTAEENKIIQDILAVLKPLWRKLKVVISMST
jgi:hypothetical protein